MRSAAILERRMQLNYDKRKTPSENIDTFYDVVKVMRYEHAKIEIEGKVIYFLDSAWQNEVGLKDITREFQEAFTAHLVEVSMSSGEDYPKELRQCKDRLQSINHDYGPTFTSVLIVTVPEGITEPELIVKYETLPEEDRLMVTRCYDLFRVLFQHLKEIVSDEEKDYERKEYVRSKSTYEWIDDKNDFSELAMAIFASGAVKRTGTKKMMPSTFARELAAFFGIDQLNFDQDIALIGERVAKRKRGEFIDKCGKKLEKYFKEKYD